MYIRHIKFKNELIAGPVFILRMAHAAVRTRL